MLSLKTCRKYLILNLCILGSYSHILPVNNIVDQEENCLNQILNISQEPVVFIMSDTYLNFINFKNSAIIQYTNSNFKIFDGYKINLYILIVHKHISIQNIFVKLKKCLILNSKAKFLVFHKNVTEYRQIFQEAWKYYIINLSIISSLLDVYTYFPYTSDRFGSINLGKWHQNLEGFPEKVPENFKGDELKIMAYPISPYVLKTNYTRSNPNIAGLEVTILNAVAEKLNLSQIYVQNPFPHWGFRYRNGTYTFMYNSLYKKEADIIFGFMYGNASYSIDFDPSFTHLTDTSVWWVPTALEIPHWKNLTFIFENKLWACTFIVLLVNASIFYIIARLRNETRFRDTILCLIVALYCLLTGSSIRPNSWLLKLLFILWVFVSLLLVTAYQSQLVSVLTNPIYQKQISSLEEVVQSSLKIGFYPTIAESLNDKNNKIHQEILRTYIPCSLDNVCIRRVAFKRDFCTFKNQRSGLYLLPKEFTFPDGRPMLYHFKQFGMLSVIRYYVNKGNPILDKIDAILMRLSSNGFISKWDADLRSTFKISNPDKIPLNLGHLLGAVYIFLFGIVSSMLAFLCEFIIYKMRHKELNGNCCE